MKKIYALSLTIIAFCVVASCGKGSSTPTPTIVGLWAGDYHIPPEVPSYHMLFRSNGTVRVFLDGIDTTYTTSTNKAEGTYTVGADSVRMHFVYADLLGTHYSAAAKMNAAADSMSGTTGYGTNTNNGVNFFSLTK